MTDVAALETAARTLCAEGKQEEAEALLRPHLASGVGPLPLWRQLAFCVRAQGRVTEARAIQEMLVDAVPADMEGRFNLAESALLLGDFERGWKEYNWRYRMAHTSSLDRRVQRPQWDGRPIPGQTLLIHDEQGYGDTFQFLRMVPWAKARSGARLVLEINPDCRSLAERAGGFDALIIHGALPPAFDRHSRLMSLPMAMGLRMADLPGTIPYLNPDPARLAKWRKTLARLARPLVALVWAGRPAHLNDSNRSVDLSQLAPLAMPGVTFLAVQKGPRAEQALTPPPGMNLIPLDEAIGDFEDTAAILCSADLLISVDSSPVHLAGALGRPAWVLLPMVPDWRWLLDREDSPWYPSIRLFRQTSRGDWDGVATRVAEALAMFRDSR